MEKIEILKLDCSPSLLPSNIRNNLNSIFYIHNSEVTPRIMVLDKTFFSTKNQNQLKIFNNSEKNEMLFAKVIKINDTYYIANGLYGGFKLWSIDGERLHFQIPAKDFIEGRVYASISICEFRLNLSLNEFDSFLCGDNYGRIFLCHGQKFKWKSQIIYNFKNTETILSLSSFLDLNLIGVTVDNGNVVILQLQSGKCDKLKEFKNEKNISLTSSIIKLDNDNYYLGCGFVNGEIKIYNMNKLNLAFTINSHLRGINSLIGFKNCFASGSDDGSINIWKVYNEKIELKYNLLFEDRMIVGVSYDKDNNFIYADAYDHQEIIKVSNLNFD